MRTFVAALLCASVFAQEETKTAAETAKDTWNSVSNWFADVTQEYLTYEQKKVPFGSYAVEAHQSMNATISYDSTAVGAAFISVNLDLSSNNTRHWEANSFSAVFFQIEEPVEDDHGHERLLQEEAPPVTGTGNYQGFTSVLGGQGSTSGTITPSRTTNVWGTVNLASANDWYTRLSNAAGGATTVDADPWQLAEGKNTFTAANATHPGVWSTAVWRLSTVGDSIKFKIIPDHDYWGHVGHKYWSAALIKANDRTKPPTQSGSSEHAAFRLDGAAATYLGLSAIATALALF